ncbi:hypothetical protein QBC38DRAFT_457904 [Podospora fimiseda]|uniref:Protein kinase domain-containing protein n=1 Tax=Podospora fimiseda TaxID=252190 RepID=A0AAN7BKB8_9PEZI|nr:hypothetical protein QBC38DRAFT_457904 [Podospora fimiseda]
MSGAPLNSDPFVSLGNTPEDNLVQACPKEYTFGGNTYRVVKILGVGGYNVAFQCSETSRDKGRILVAVCGKQTLSWNDCFQLNNQPKPRQDLEIVNYITRRKIESPPQFECFFTETLGGDYLPSGNNFYKVSYMPIYNGGTVGKWGYNGGDPEDRYIPPVSVVARFIRQILGALHWLSHNHGDRMIRHADIHGGNIFMHFPGWDTENDRPYPPNFYLGDWDLAKFYNLDPTNRLLFADRRDRAIQTDFNFLQAFISSLCSYVEYGQTTGIRGTGQYPCGNIVWDRLEALQYATSSRQRDVSNTDAPLPGQPPRPHLADFSDLIESAHELEHLTDRGGDEDPLKYEIASTIWFDFYHTRYLNATKSAGRPAYPV